MAHLGETESVCLLFRGVPYSEVMCIGMGLFGERCRF